MTLLEKLAEMIESKLAVRLTVHLKNGEKIVDALLCSVGSDFVHLRQATPGVKAAPKIFLVCRDHIGTIEF